LRRRVLRPGKGKLQYAGIVMCNGAKSTLTTHLVHWAASFLCSMIRLLHGKCHFKGVVLGTYNEIVGTWHHWMGGVKLICVEILCLITEFTSIETANSITAAVSNLNRTYLSQSIGLNRVLMGLHRNPLDLYVGLVEHSTSFGTCSS